MTFPSVVPGTYFDIAVDPQKDGTFTTLCGMTTRNFQIGTQTADEYLRDCADPTMVPYRALNITGQSATINGTGLYNRAQGDLIRSLLGQSFPYRYIMGEDADDAVDSGYWEGNFALTDLQFGASDGAKVSAQLTFQSDGQFAWVPGADIIVLDILDLTPKTATIATTYTGTVAGLTAGSTLVATSSDSTVLTVSGTGTTRTIATDSSGFAATGNKTITLVETLAAAANSPRTTKIIVAAKAA